MMDWITIITAALTFVSGGDTVIDSVPVPLKEIVTKYIPLTDTIIRNDTIYIPFIQKEYSTDNYHAWVSGYRPTLDSIVVYPKIKSFHGCKIYLFCIELFLYIIYLLQV